MKTKPCKPPRTRHDWEHYANKTVIRRFADGSVELRRRGIWYCTACTAAKYGEAREQVHVVVGDEPPNVEVTGPRRRGALAVKQMMNLGCFAARVSCRSGSG